MTESEWSGGDVPHRSVFHREVVRFTLMVAIAGVVHAVLTDLVARPVLLLVPSGGVSLVLLGAESALTGALFVMCLQCIANARWVHNAVGPYGASVVLATCAVLIIHILLTSVLLLFVLDGSLALGLGASQLIVRAALVVVVYLFIVQTWDSNASHWVMSDATARMLTLIVVVGGVAYAALVDLITRTLFLIPYEAVWLYLMGTNSAFTVALFVMCLECIFNVRWVRRAVGTREFLRFTLMVVIAGVAYAVLTDLVVRPVLLLVPNGDMSLFLLAADSVITGALLIMCLECVANARWVQDAVGPLGAFMVLGTCAVLIIHILLTNVVLQFMLPGSVSLGPGPSQVVVRAALAVVVYLFLARTWESHPVQSVSASGGPESR